MQTTVCPVLTVTGLVTLPKLSVIRTLLLDANMWQQAYSQLRIRLAKAWPQLQLVLQELSWRRLLLIGAAVYLLVPLLPTPWWQLQLAVQGQASANSTLNKLTDFYQQQGEAMLPALSAQLRLDQLSALAARYEAEQAEFSAQSRDQNWAEATEFLIQHLAANQTEEPLTLADVECRNTLCRVEIITAAGLTPQIQQRVLKLAGSLKTADLEFQDLTPSRTELVLLFKSSKALKLGFFAERRLNPAEKAAWQQSIKNWLYPVPADPANASAEAKP